MPPGNEGPGSSRAVSIASRPAEPRPQERRQVSVLFCDLVGYSSLAENRDPEDVRELLSGYFDLARSVVTRYGGTVEKFIGDAVMAVWGTPKSQEDDAERAVRAGLELVSAIGPYGAVEGVELSARVGVATGEAATVDVATEGLVTGDRVNTAARIQALAAPGSCYVDSLTMRLTESSISYEDAGMHPLKGRSAPEQLHRALRVFAGVGGRYRASGLEAPFVGRDPELRALKDLFHASVDRRSPRLVVVMGPAGVGKSRLAWEFEKYIDGLADGVFWHRGRCLSYGEGVAFWALAEIVRQRLSIAEDDAPPVARDKLRNELSRLVPGGERDFVCACLAQLLGVGHELADPTMESPRTMPREELFAGWRVFFENLARVAPVALVIEEGQHADDTLLEFLDHLIDWVKDVPVFVLVLTRSELLERVPGFGVGRNRTTLSLDPLDATSMESLVDALVPGIDPQGRTTITDRARGIPLFAVETVRALIDSQVVIADNDSYRLVGEIGDLAVPDSLHSLLAARLDALSLASRALAATASIFGTSFASEALGAISGHPPDEVAAALEDLVKRDVLEVSADPLSPQRGHYRFSQDMLRRVAYETLPRRERKALHLTVASHLRSAFPNDGEEISDVIARHYLDALGLVPEDSDTANLREEALFMLVRAGQRAERAGAPSRAASNYAEAASLAEARQVDRAASLWERAARASGLASDNAGSLEHAQAARRCYQRAGDVRAAARAQMLMGRALRQRERSEAEVQLAEALSILREQDDPDTVEALEELAALRLLDGRPEGEKLSAEALALGQAVGVDNGLLSVLFTTRGIGASVAGRISEAAANLREAARLAEEASEIQGLTRALLNLASVLGGVRPAAAAEAARRASEHARRIGARMLLAVSTINLASALLELGDWREADRVLGSGIGDDGLGDFEMLRCWSGILAALTGDTVKAVAALDSLPGMRASEAPQEMAEFLTLDALTAWVRGRDDEALAHALRVLDQLPAVGIQNECVRWAWPLAARLAADLRDEPATLRLLNVLDDHPEGHIPPVLRAERLLVQARSLADAGDAEAEKAFPGAIAALRKAANPYRLGWGLLDQAACLVGWGHAEPARAAVEEAKAIGAELASTPLLRRADALIEALTAAS